MKQTHILARAVASSGLYQTALQLLALGTGLLIVRFLSADQYAIYTIAFAIAGTCSLLGDSGIATSAMAIAGRGYQDRRALGVALVSAIHIRKKLSVAVASIMFPVSLWLLTTNGASLFEALGLAASLVLLTFASATTGVYEVAPKLHQQLDSHYRVQLISAVQRLATTAVILITLPLAVWLIIGNCVIQFMTNRRALKLAAATADLRAVPSVEDQREILASVKRVFPGAVYYAVSGQITIWFAAIFSSSQSVANLGALGRVAMLASLLSSIAAIVFVPRFARLPKETKLLRIRFWQVQSAVFFASLILIAGTFVWSSQILSVLGSTYAGLHKELLLSMIAACMNVQQGVTYSLSSHRGNVMHPGISIGISVASTLALILVLDISNILGILHFSILYAGIQYIVWAVYCEAKTLR